MTQLHGARSGHFIRARRRDHRTTGPKQCRRHPHHGIVDGRESPRRISVGDRSARKRGQDHSRRSPLHAHFGDGGYLGAAAGGHRHHFSRRADPLRTREQPVLPRVRDQLHQRPDHHPRGFPRHRRPGRRVLRLGLRKGKVRSGELAVSGRSSEGGEVQTRACCRRRRTRQGSWRRSAGSGQVRGRPRLAASALRVPAPEAALLQIYPGNGGASLRRFRRCLPEGCGRVYLVFWCGKDSRDLLRGRLDPALKGSANYPDSGHPAATAR
jgi:hypothetical protein